MATWRVLWIPLLQQEIVFQGDLVSRSTFFLASNTLSLLVFGVNEQRRTDQAQAAGRSRAQQGNEAHIKSNKETFQ
jgi:hypothetical protein